MCIAIVSPAGRKVPVSILEKAFLYNRHGGGLAYIDPAKAGTDKDPKVQVRKGFFKLDDFLDAYHPIYAKYGEENPMLLHFRVATMGKVTMHNCHPFKLADGALIHNGHFVGWNRTLDAEFSDTHLFVNAIRNNMRFEDAKAAMTEIEKAIGLHNKVATLHENGEYLLFNRHNWTYHEGVWYSNKGPLPPITHT